MGVHIKNWSITDWKELLKWAKVGANNAMIGEFAEVEEIPPHGDLIDRDALSKSLDRLCDRVCQYSKAQRKVMCSACPLGDAFSVVEDDAPTVIPASDKDTNVLGKEEGE